MIKKYDKKLSVTLIADRLYCMVFSTLKGLNPSVTQLNPVEIWMAAKEFTEQLVDCLEPEELMDYFVETLRGEVEGKDDAFLIMMVSITQLSARRKSIDNADELILKLMPYCRPNVMYRKLFEMFSNKENEMKMVGKKVEIMTYTFTELKEESQTQSIGKMTELLDLALSMPGSDFTSTLLAFSIFNIQCGNAFNKMVLDYYDRMVEKNTPKPSIEMTLGNKNVAQNGGVQMNTDSGQTSSAQMLELFNQLKQLK